MFRRASIVLLFLCFFVGQAQEVSLPADLRQHALTQYNASLFNPSFSLDRNNPQSVSLWTRWQWQNIDADPTTLFLNYTRSLNTSSAAGIGFFQQNTGIFFNTGGVLNYAYQIEFNQLIKISFGANVFGFVQELSDTRFPITPIPGIPQSIPTNDFILQVAPGFNIQVENFSLSLASENLFDYNFTDTTSNTAASDKIFMGMASYDFPVLASDSTAYIRPSIYLRTIPEQENQIGLNVLFSTKKFWVQSGYNNFYGISVGGGGTFFNRFSLGALVEFGASSSVRTRNVALNPENPTFEIIASYFLGKPEKRRLLVTSGIEELEQIATLNQEQPTNAEIQKELEKAEKFSNQETKKVEEDQIESQDENSIDEINEVVEEIKEDKKEARKLAAEQKALKKQKRKDSIIAIKKEKEALNVLKKQEAEEAKKNADEETKAEAQRIEQQRKLDSISDARKALAMAAEFKLKEQRQQDSIREAKKTETIAAAAKVKEQQGFDTITKANEAKELEVKKKAAEEAVIVAKVVKTEQAVPEVVKPQAGEKYEEVANEDGLEPGYYLIANVFGTKKYFDAFMGDLRSKGLQPKSFLRSLNKYNYAYLDRYTTIREARQARDSKFNGKYNGKTWIFRVVGK